MVCDGFDDVPQVALPAGDRFRAYRDGDDDVWMTVQRAAEPLINIVDELFENEYGAHREALAERMWFVETDEGTPVEDMWYCVDDDGVECVDTEGEIAAGYDETYAEYGLQYETYMNADNLR